MFELNEKLNRLDIPAKNVLRLHRSLGDVQIALPGLSSQMATAYICAFSAGMGARVAIALRLHNDYKVIYYLNAGGEISSDKASSVLNQAINFCETLGFMMSDLEIHKMNPSEKNDFWDSLPLKTPPVKPAPAPAAKKAGGRGEDADVIEEAEELSTEESVEIDLGLPRRQLAAKSKKERPSQEQTDKKRDRLRENLGRFLSSL